MSMTVQSPGSPRSGVDPHAVVVAVRRARATPPAAPSDRDEPRRPSPHRSVSSRSADQQVGCRQAGRTLRRRAPSSPRPSKRRPRSLAGERCPVRRSVPSLPATAATTTSARAGDLGRARGASCPGARRPRVSSTVARPLLGGAGARCTAAVPCVAMRELGVDGTGSDVAASRPSHGVSVRRCRCATKSAVPMCGR